MVLGNLIGGFIMILVGTGLMPAVANQVYLTQYTPNATGANVLKTNITGTVSGSVIALIPLFFAIGIMAGGVAMAVQGLKNAGML